MSTGYNIYKTTPFKQEQNKQNKPSVNVHLYSALQLHVCSHKVIVLDGDNGERGVWWVEEVGGGGAVLELLVGVDRKK